MSRDRQVPDQRLVDYQILMDRMLGNTTTFEYAKVERRGELIRTGDMTDWIVAMQGSGDEALTRALQQWKATRATPWLLAALWKVPPQHGEAAALLAAAEKVDQSSPAFPTAAFLRVRLLADRGDIAAARRLLAALPSTPGGGFPAEAINLLAAERFMLAESFDELLTNAPRRVVYRGESAALAAGTLAFDEDAGHLFSERLPLERLIQASLSEALPDRLRVRVAGAAFTRAVLLRRVDDSRRVLPVLEKLSPSLRADLQRYATASTPEERQFAAVHVLLRTPGLDFAVRGMDDSDTFDLTELPRELAHAHPRNWWCGTTDYRRPYGGGATSEVMSLLYGQNAVPYPSFLTPAERGAAQKEIEALMALPPAPNYLADEAVKWARARPKDIDAAEALARAVEGTRWGCGDERTGESSRRAFQTLHRLFPTTAWARRTKYWYSGR